jgi:hypothetical protein
VAIKATWFTLSADQQRDLDERAKSPGWRVVGGQELPAVFPEALREKIDSAVVVATPTSTGGTYLVYSANRVDYKPQKIDIQPFGLIVHSTGPSSSGVFLDHGNWEGRTASPPAGFWASGIRRNKAASGTISWRIHPKVFAKAHLINFRRATVVRSMPL